MSEAAALAGRLGIQDVRFRAYQVDRTGGILEDLSTALNYGGEVRHNNDQAVARTIACTFNAQQLPSSFLTAAPALFNVRMDYEAYYDGAWHTYPRGIFWCDHPAEEYRPDTAVWTIQGSDLSLILSLSTTSDTYVVPAGTPYLSHVSLIISNAGLAVGFDPNSLSWVTPVDFVWQANTSWLTICNDLLQGINWFPLQVDSLGQFITRAKVTPASDTPAIAYTIFGDTAMIIEPFRQSRGTITQAINRLKVTIDDSTRASTFTELTNTDPNSPISTVTLGYVKSQEMRSDSGTKCVVDALTVQNICDYELQLANCHALPAELQTFPDPRREGLEYYTVSVSAPGGLAITNQPYRCTGWTLPLAPGGIMVHQLEQANLVLLTG